MSFSMCMYCNANASFFPYLVISAASPACSNLNRRGVNVCFLSGCQGAIIPSLREQSLQQNLFALVAEGAKRVRSPTVSALGYAVQGAGLWGSAQPNKWAQAWLARAICNAECLPEKSVSQCLKGGKKIIIFFSSSAYNFIMQAPALSFAYRLGWKVL